MKDIVDEMIEVLREQLADRGVELPESDLEVIETRLRLRFGGEQAYICKRQDRERRDMEIARAHRLGIPVSVLAARYGLTPRRIWGIAKQERARGAA